MIQDRQRVLFLCSMNRMRSPTAEKVFTWVPGLQPRSAGLDSGAATRCTKGALEWADLVFVMEKKHLSMLGRQFGPMLRGKAPINLGIPDRFDCMQRELVELLLQKVPPFLRVPVDVDSVRQALRLNDVDTPPFPGACW
jgi:predicted protein tyrosine phosphatase